MSYSKQSQQLAHKVAQRAARNLERSGKTVSRSAVTGRYVVTKSAARNPRTTVTEQRSN